MWISTTGTAIADRLDTLAFYTTWMKDHRTGADRHPNGGTIEEFLADLLLTTTEHPTHRIRGQR